MCILWFQHKITMAGPPKHMAKKTQDNMSVLLKSMKTDITKDINAKFKQISSLITGTGGVNSRIKKLERAAPLVSKQVQNMETSVGENALEILDINVTWYLGTR